MFSRDGRSDGVRGQVATWSHRGRGDHFVQHVISLAKECALILMEGDVRADLQALSWLLLSRLLILSS